MIVFKIAGIILVALILLQIWVTHAMITQGSSLKKIEDLQKALAEENLILENQIATSSAFAKIASDSASLGFSLPKSLQYIR